MIRRKTKRNLQTKRIGSIVGSRARTSHMKSGRGVSGRSLASSEMRFKVSLVILMALLSISAYLFVFVLALNSSPRALGSSGSINTNIFRKAISSKVLARSSVLNDSSLDFKLTIPKEIGAWIYKIGYVKDPLDDSQSDQYVKIYLPLGMKTISSNFDDQYKEVLTIIKFPKKNWNKLDSGCQKGNSSYCDQAGTKIGENDESVFAYIKMDDCPQALQSKCLNIGKIIDSFQLK